MKINGGKKKKKRNLCGHDGVCVYVCVYVCMCGFGITIEDSNKEIPSPRSTIEWEQLVLDRHTMGELELLYRFIPLLQRGRQYSPRV